MSKVEYVGPRVEISNHGVTYRRSKEDKYIYLMVALEILKDIDNDYAMKSSYTHDFKNKILEENDLHSILKSYENSVEECITEECEKYKLKLQHELEFIQKIPHLTEMDKEIWKKNSDIMKQYRVQRAINKMYYMHCIKNIAQVIQHKNISEITVPFNQCFFHVLNTLRGALITGKPSLRAKVIEEMDKNNNMVVKLTIKN